MEITTVDIIGVWIGLFLTMAVFSFLYDDNPIYKFTEHLFMGISLGYGGSETYWAVIKPKLLDKLVVGQVSDTMWSNPGLEQAPWTFSSNLSRGIEAFDPLYLIPLVLFVLLLGKLSRKHAWLARYPLAILVAAFAAVKVTAEANGRLIIQVGNTMPDLAESWANNGWWSWAADGGGVLSDTLLVVGLMCALIHFYFSEVPQKIARAAPWVSAVVFIVVTVTSYLLITIPESTGLAEQAASGSQLTGKLVCSVLLGLCTATPFIAISKYKPRFTRFGVMVLMVSFGASFGFTVMGRLSLAIGRAQHMLGQDKHSTRVQAQWRHCML